MIEVDVTANNNLLMVLQAKLDMLSGKSNKVFPAASMAFSMGTKMVQKAWQSWCMGDTIDGLTIDSPNSRLSQSIRIRQNGVFDYSIYSNSPRMEEIIKGRDEYDMKPALVNGPRSRVVQSGPNKGRKYNIIPFRWRTPTGNLKRFSPGEVSFNLIPQSIYQLLKSREATYRTGETHFEPNARGQQVERSNYSGWKGSISEFDAGDNGRLVGLSRIMDESGPRPKSVYFTFRIVHEGQTGKWVRKAVEGKNIVEVLEKKYKAKVEESVQQGLMADLGL